MSRYDVAQICLNGHEINSRARTSPEYNQNFCDQCGEETIKQCKNCNEPIRGEFIGDGMIIGGGFYDVPSYCHNCGKPFPWIESSINSAKEVLELDDKISEEDKEKLISSIREISKDSPKTELNALKIKKIAKKLGKDTYDVFYKIAIDVGTEIAKKTLIGG